MFLLVSQVRFWFSLPNKPDALATLATAPDSDATEFAAAAAVGFATGDCRSSTHEPAGLVAWQSVFTVRFAARRQGAFHQAIALFGIPGAILKAAV